MKIEQAKPHSVHLRLNEEQFNFLRELATTTDLGISDLIRMIVNTTMVASQKAGEVLTETVVNLDAKLGEPHADNPNSF